MRDPRVDAAADLDRAAQNVGRALDRLSGRLPLREVDRLLREFHRLLALSNRIGETSLLKRSRGAPPERHRVEPRVEQLDFVGGPHDGMPFKVDLSLDELAELDGNTLRFPSRASGRLITVAEAQTYPLAELVRRDIMLYRVDAKAGALVYVGVASPGGES